MSVEAVLVTTEATAKMVSTLTHVSVPLDILDPAVKLVK